MLCKNLKIKIYATTKFFVVWHLGSQVEGGIHAEGIGEQGGHEDIGV
jgi:hypothetical protein